MLSSNSSKGFQQFSSINVYEVLDVMLKSRADSTTKAYVRVIRKFLDWSKSRHFNKQLPFPLSVNKSQIVFGLSDCFRTPFFWCIKQIACLFCLISNFDTSSLIINKTKKSLFLAY